MKTSIVLILLVLSLTPVCLAAEYPYLYKGVRPMGMGGAFVAVSDDAHALFYNPAGLADITEAQAAIFPLEIELGENAWSVYRDARGVDFDSEQEVARFLREHIGKRSRFGLGFVPSYARPNFALCLLGTFRADLEARDRQFPRVVASAVRDVGIGAGYARGFFDDTLLIGGSVKFISRQSLGEEYTFIDIIADDFEDRVEDDMKKGSGVLFDIGVIYRLDELLLPGLRAGISAHNLIGGDLGKAQDLDEHVDIGFALDRALWITQTTFALDFGDLFAQRGDDSDVAKRLRLGVEMRFPRLLALRAGIYQGYFTAGMTLGKTTSGIDLMTYAEEIGAYAGQRVDRRYVARLTLGF